MPEIHKISIHKSFVGDALTSFVLSTDLDVRTIEQLLNSAAAAMEAKNRIETSCNVHDGGRIVDMALCHHKSCETFSVECIWYERINQKLISI